MQAVSCWSLNGELHCGSCTSAALEEPVTHESDDEEEVVEEVVASSPPKRRTVVEEDLEVAALALGLDKGASYADRRAALFTEALGHSKRPELSAGWRPASRDFAAAWRAFHALNQRKFPLERKRVWAADDLFPQLQSAERPSASVPMPRLMTAGCAEARVENETLVFLVTSTLSTRFEMVKRTYDELKALDAKLRKKLFDSLPALPPGFRRNSGAEFWKNLFSSKSRDDDPREDTLSADDDALPKKPLASARRQVSRYLRYASAELAAKGLYSEDLLDFLGVDGFARRRLHCDDVKLFLKLFHDQDVSPAEDFAVAVDWHDTWLAFLRSETDYYAPPGPVQNKDLAALMAQHAVHRDGDISDEYALHAPAKWAFVTTVYGPPDLTLRLPRRRGGATTTHLVSSSRT